MYAAAVICCIHIAAAHLGVPLCSLKRQRDVRSSVACCGNSMAQLQRLCRPAGPSAGGSGGVGWWQGSAGAMTFCVSCRDPHGGAGWLHTGREAAAMRRQYDLGITGICTA